MDGLEQKFSVIHDLFYSQFESWLKQKNPSTFRDGVYTLYANKTISRALGNDTEGVLYIGKGIIADPLRPRIGRLINSLNNTANNHEAGERYVQKYVDRFPLTELVLKVELFEDARKVEQERLSAYLDRFGEFPPLNRIS